MAQVGLGAISATLQNTIISILNSDTASITFTYKDNTTGASSLSSFKILDGLPSELLRGTGFPYIIVHTPEENTQRLTAGFAPTFVSILEIQIDVVDKMEGNVRLIADRIRQRLYNLRATSGTTTGTRPQNFILHYGGGITRNNISQQFLPDGERVWVNTIFVTYRWLGDSD